MDWAEAMNARMSAVHTRVSESAELRAMLEDAQKNFLAMVEADIISAFELTDCLLEVVEVESGSPAQLAGVNVGDWLLAVNGVTPASPIEVNEKDGKVVFLKAGDLDSAIEITLKSGMLRTGSTEAPMYAMTLLWYSYRLAGKPCFWNSVDMSWIATRFLKLGKPKQALDAIGARDGLPAKAPLATAEVDCCDAFLTCEEATDGRTARITIRGSAEFAVLRAAAMALLGDYRYADMIVDEFDRSHREYFTSDMGVLTDVVSIYVQAFNARHITSASVDELMALAGNLSAHGLANMLAEATLHTFAPYALAEFRARRHEENPLVGCKVPDLVLPPLVPADFAPPDDRGLVSLSSRISALGPKQLLAVVYMGSYRTNGPYDNLVRQFTSLMGFTVPHFVVGAVVVTHSSNTASNDRFTRNWIAGEDEARLAKVPWTVLKGSEEEMDFWERQLFRGAKDTDGHGFTGAPTFLLVDAQARVRSVGDWGLTETIVKLQDLAPTASKDIPVATVVVEEAPRPAAMLRDASRKWK